MRVMYRSPCTEREPRGYALGPADLDRLIREAGSTNHRMAARLEALGRSIDARRLSNWRSGARKMPRDPKLTAAIAEAAHAEYLEAHPDEAPFVGLIRETGLPWWPFAQDLGEIMIANREERARRR